LIEGAPIDLDVEATRTAVFLTAVAGDLETAAVAASTDECGE